jgi:ATP-dependent Clp protease ATP-binding subunit ClpC
MSLPLSRELGSLLAQARDISRKTGHPLSSAHVLLAMFTVPNGAAVFLKDREITVDKLLTALTEYPEEPAEILQRVHERGQRIAQGSGAEEFSSLHLLAAIVREKLSLAYRLLDECGGNIGAIRASVMSYATASRPLPRRFQFTDEGAELPQDDHHDDPIFHDEHAPSPIGFHPLLEVRTARSRVVPPASVAEPAPVVTPPVQGRPVEASLSPVVEEEPRRPVAEARRGKVERTPESLDPEAADEARRTARRLAEELFAKRKQAERLAREREEQRRRQVEPPDRAGEPNVSGSADEDPGQASHVQARREPEETAPIASEPEMSSPIDQEIGSESSQVELEPDPDLSERYQLDPKEYPNLVKFGRNLTEEAALGHIDPVVGRDAEIGQLIDILGKRRSNNPLLVGEPGVGKTAIVEGLACKFVRMARKGDRLGQRAIIELEMGRLLSGTHLRGSFSERLISIKDEVRRAGGQVIIFLDEVHGWIAAGGGGDGGDAASELKTALARGQFPCIGATTHDEFRKFIESDPAFERRFQAVQVDEPDPETAMTIIRGVRRHYERHHGVRYSTEAIEASVKLSARYIHDRQLPDKAIGVLDWAGSRAARTGLTLVERDDVARVVAEMAGIPVDRLTQHDRERFLRMESVLADGIVGHEEIIAVISDVIRRNYAGFRSSRPIGSLLFLGPTGVGKTEMVKVLADFLFHDRDAIVRMDMSEFMEAHSVSRLIGAPPGYVGFDQGGQLTEPIRRRPYQVVLLDEVEKAHPDVLNLLLQLFDEGRLTDGRGRAVDFSNALVIMTSNLGAEVFRDQQARPARGIGFAGVDASAVVDQGRKDLADKVLASARQHFTPELWNRIDERVVFLPLERAQVARIARLQLIDSSRRLSGEGEIRLDVDDAVIEFLIERGGFDPLLGARPMRQTIQRLIEGEVARLILHGDARRGMTVKVRVVDGALSFTTA